MTNEEMQELLDLECRKEIQKALNQAVADGFMETVGFDKEGRTLYRLTNLGVMEVEAQVEGDRS